MPEQKILFFNKDQLKFARERVIEVNEIFNEFNIPLKAVEKKIRRMVYSDQKYKFTYRHIESFKNSWEYNYNRIFYEDLFSELAKESRFWYHFYSYRSEDFLKMDANCRLKGFI